MALAEVLAWTGHTALVTVADGDQHVVATSSRMSTMDIRGGLTFDPVPTGTRMRWSWELMPRGVFKLLTSMVARIGRARSRESGAISKRVMEAQAAPSSSAGV